MKNENKFVVSRYENRSGATSWRVNGWLHGVRIRRNFKSRDEAAAEKSMLELKVVQQNAGMRSVMTFLTDAQLRESEDAFRRLNGRAKSLMFHLEFALTNYRPPMSEKLVDEAATAYLKVKETEQAQSLISSAMLTTIKRQLKGLAKSFPGMTVANLSSSVLTAYLQRGKPCLKTYNNRRGLVSTFLKFCEQQEWLATNPITKVPYYRIARRRGSAKTISATQAQDLMTYVEGFEGGRLVPYFALCLFAGIRPCVRTGEILRLKAEHIDLKAGVIRVEPDVSKVKELRRVCIQPNLAAWLRAYPLDQFPIIVPNLQKTRARIAKRFGLTHDVMRHTFISMHVAKFRSIGEAALQAGNSESIIKKHYLDLKSREEAEKFFGILPLVALAASLSPDTMQVKPAA
jgi:integrase